MVKPWKIGARREILRELEVLCINSRGNVTHYSKIAASMTPSEIRREIDTLFYLKNYGLGEIRRNLRGCYFFRRGLIRHVSLFDEIVENYNDGLAFLSGIQAGAG
jgi:hypothetical protein